MKDVRQIFILYSCWQFYFEQIAFVIKADDEEGRVSYNWRGLGVELSEVLLCPLNGSFGGCFGFDFEKRVFLFFLFLHFQIIKFPNIQIQQNGQRLYLQLIYLSFIPHYQFINLKAYSMIDRLPQLKKNLAITNESMSDNELNGQNPYEENADQNEQGIDDQFIQDIKSVREMIAALKNNNYRIQSIKAKYAKAIKSAQQHQNSDQMNQILKINYKLNQNIKQKLISIQNQVKEAEKNQKDEPETRMKKNFYISLTKQVSDILEKQQEYESQYKNTVKDKVTRQVRLIDRDITQQDMEEYVNNPDLAQQMLQKKIYGQASITLKNTVSDIQDKFRDIKNLESSVEQCVQLFNQLAALVQVQGQKIDSIQAHVADTKDYVNKAEVKLKKAKQHHQCSKKCLCIGIVVGLVILIIVVIIVVVATKK